MGDQSEVMQPHDGSSEAHNEITYPEGRGDGYGNAGDNHNNPTDNADPVNLHPHPLPGSSGRGGVMKIVELADCT